MFSPEKKNKVASSTKKIYLLWQLTDEVLGKLLELVSLQSGQRLRHWGPQTHCRGLNTEQAMLAPNGWEGQKKYK